MIEEIKTISEVQNAAIELEKEISNYVVGWSDVIRFLIIGIFTGGHILIEGVPGTAKTYLAKIFSDTMNLSFHRIQSTPDLMPSDITGSHIFNVKTLEFDFHRGPIFANLVLMDEINRAPPKTQAALLEAMQEGQVTVDGVTSILDRPFMIVANRFMARLIMNYPPKESWIDVLEKKNQRGEIVNVNPILNQSAVLSAQKIIQTQITVSDDILSYIADFCRTTRDSNRIILGASPTASVSLLSAARGYAAVVHGRDHVTMDDVKDVSFDVLNHRLIIRELESENAAKDYGINQIQEILTSTMESIK